MFSYGRFHSSMFTLFRVIVIIQKTKGAEMFSISSIYLNISSISYSTSNELITSRQSTYENAHISKLFFAKAEYLKLYQQQK